VEVLVSQPLHPEGEGTVSDQGPSVSTAKTENSADTWADVPSLMLCVPMHVPQVVAVPKPPSITTSGAELDASFSSSQLNG
jgi:hypothetical protein